MKNLQTLGALAMLVVPLACGNTDDIAIDELSQQVVVAAAPMTTFKVGVLVDAASPAKSNFTSAALLAGSQINEALTSAAISQRFDIVVASYASGQARAVAIDLINNKGVLAMVTDTNATTTAVNGLNYEFPVPITHKVTVTCYQCNSPDFNNPTAIDPGSADVENWLFRTYYNATFEPAVQVRLVLSRPQQGDFNVDGFLKIVVYYDGDHFFPALAMQEILDNLHAGPHSLKLVAKSLPSTPATRNAELADVFSSAPEGRLPDAIYLAFTPGNFPEALSDYTSHAPARKPPAQADNDIRRDFRLASLLAIGGANLEGSSVLQVSSSASGPLFKSAFVAATNKQPELTASFLYDAVVAQVTAIGVAKSNGTVTPDTIKNSFASINDPAGLVIRPRVSDFKTAALRIKNHQPINYDGASSSLELTSDGEMYPELVHWKIQSSKFVELERYQCDPSRPTCP
jgi:hypothetical protein